VEHEGQPFGRIECLQHHHQRQADGIGHHRLLFRACAVLRAADRLGFPGTDVELPAGAPGAQHVQADPAHHGGQPAAEVRDGLVV